MELTLNTTPTAVLLEQTTFLLGVKKLILDK